MPPSRPMIGATTARSPAQRAEEEDEAGDLEHARQHGEAERPQVVVPWGPSSASASGRVQEAVADQDHERRHVRVDGAAERDDPEVEGRPRERREQAECDRHPPLRYCRGSAWPTRMPSRSRASSSATRPCSCSPARASRRPAGCPTSARRAACGSGSIRWSTGTSTCSRAIPRASGSAGPSRSSARASLHNPAHAALAQLEAGGFVSGVVTQNIDGLHHAAGSDAVEVHGHLRTARCMRCGAEEAMGSALERYAEPAGWRPSASSLRRDAAAAGRALRRAAARSRPGASPPRSSRARAAACASVRRCRSTRRPGSPRRSRGARRPLAIVSREATSLWEDADPAAAALGRGAPARRRGHTSRRTSRFTLKLLPREAARAGQDPSQPFECRCAL